MVLFKGVSYSLGKLEAKKILNLLHRAGGFGLWPFGYHKVFTMEATVLEVEFSLRPVADSFLEPME